MSSPEPERPEYERRVVRHLRRTPVEGDLQVNHLGRPVRFEEVRRGVREAKSSVILFRAPDRPGCLFGRREDAGGPHEPWQDPQREGVRRMGGYGLDLPDGGPRDPARLAEGVRAWCHDMGVKG